ncbi:unnamed protein product [Trichobilharzia szidati]|nr:unnamed protein product [Trichobilharzia szidati]
MLRCVKRKTSKSRTPTPRGTDERGCSTLPRMGHRSESDENISEKPSSSSRPTRWTMEKKSATLTAGCTLSSGNETKTKNKTLTFLRTLSLGSLFSPSRRRRKDDSTTAYSSGLMSPDVELQTFSNDSHPNIQQGQDETDLSPSEGSLTPTAEETYQPQSKQSHKQELFLEKLTKEAFNFSRDDKNKTPTDENANILSEGKHFHRHLDDQHDSGRSSTRESAEVSVASDRSKRKGPTSGVPNEPEKQSVVVHKIAPIAIDSKQAEANQSFLRAARAGNLPKVLELLNTITDIDVANNNGLNALHLASKEGRTGVVRELLSHGASVHLITKKGNTALHIASLAGHLDIVKLLIDCGADVNAQSQNGFTPLYMSAQENHVEVVQLLLDKSANQALSTEDGFTPLAVALQQGHDRVVSLLLERDSRGKSRLPALHIAAKKDDVHAANLLLSNTEINVDHTSASGFTPLHIAAHYGNVNIARLLIERGANINYQAKNYITPLHVAAKWGKNDVVNLLIQAGAEVNSRTRDGLTPLHCAARAGQTSTMECLLKRGADVSVKTKNDLTPLHMAAQGDHEQVTRLLLESGSNPNDVTIDYLTPLHVAAHCGNVNVARTLLNSHCDVNARALNGFTALHIACKKSRVEMASLLLKHGALLEAATETGLTPLHVASFVGCGDIVSFLLQHGTNVNQTTLRNETALHLAVRNGQLETVKILLGYQANLDCRTRDNQTPLHVAVRTNHSPIVELLLKAGADINMMTKDNYSALHIATKEDSQDIVQMLIEHGANTEKGFTPLHLAAKYGSSRITDLLLNHAKSDPNASGRNGFTPVHVATYYNNNQVLKKLIECGGDVNRPVRNGFTPLHLAAKRNNLESVRLLASKGAVIDRGSRSGYTPLHLASQDGRIEIVKLLVEEYKAQVDCAAKDGLTPLHLAVQEDKVNVSEYLLNSGASTDTKTLEAGFTPLHSAAYRGQLASLRLLLTRISEKELPQVINSRTHLGSTPLHLAAQQGHLQIALKLIQMGADQNCRNKQGWTAAQIAHKQHYLNLFETLQAITTDASDWAVPNVNGTDVDGHADGDADLVNGTVVLEKAEHMTDHIISDSEEEGEDSWLRTGSYDLLCNQLEYMRARTGEHDLTRLPGMSTLYAKGISLRPKTLNISGQRPVVSGDETVRSSLHGSLIEERGEPLFSGKTETVTTSQKLAGLPMITPSPTTLSEWDFDVDNVHSVRKPVKSGFLISFLVDARGGLVEAQRRPDLRFLVPPNAPTGPLRIICRLLRPGIINNPPGFNDGDCLACRIIEMSPYQMRFSLPILIEVPHIVSGRGREREIIIIRSETGNSWKEHTLEATEQAIHDSLGDAFDHSDLSNATLNKRIHRILTYDFPQYFALISRFRQEVAYIGSDGGLISSTVVPQVQAVFPPGSLQKRIKVGLQAQPISSDIVNRIAGCRVSVSPIVSIEPRRRKFHKPITLTIPVPRSTSKPCPDAAAISSKIRLLCSLSGGTNPAVWEDITGSTPMTRHKDCVSFTTTVSARLWLIDCPNNVSVKELATRIYGESIEPPILGRFVIYARHSTDLKAAIKPETLETQSRHSSNAQDVRRSIPPVKRSATEFAQIRCICLTDDTEDKTLECLEHYYQVAIGPFVEIQQNKPVWIEMVGNLVPVLKSGEQLNFTIRPFYENRITFPVRLRDVPDLEPDINMVTGKIAFMREARNVQTTKDMTNTQPQRPITVLEFKLPSPDQTLVLSTKELDVIGRSELDHQKLALGIGKDWRRLAPVLGFSEQDVKMIDRISPDLDSATNEFDIENQRAENLLALWKHRAAASGLTDKDALGNHLADALIKINRSDTIHPSMTEIRTVAVEEEIVTANEILEKRTTLPVVVEETSSHAKPDKIPTHARYETPDFPADMKNQEVKDIREQETEPVFSWSENAFLSSDEGVSTISVSGTTDGIRKPEATFSQPLCQADLTDQEKLPVNTKKLPIPSTSVVRQAGTIEAGILPELKRELEERTPEDNIDVSRTKTLVNWQEALLAQLESVGIRMETLTKPSQVAVPENEEPVYSMEEVFIKPISQHVEQKSFPKDRKEMENFAQELAETLGKQVDDAVLVEQIPLSGLAEIIEDIIEPVTNDREVRIASVALEHSVVSQSPSASTADFTMNDAEMNKFGTAVSNISQGSSSERYMPHDNLQPYPNTNALQKMHEYLEEQASSATVSNEERFEREEDLSSELHIPSLENLVDDESFENAYRKALRVDTSQQIGNIQDAKPTLDEIPTTGLQSEVSPSHVLQIDSVIPDIIQPIPKESHEFEEIEEILPDGTIVTKRTESEETTLSVTPDEWEQGVQSAIDSGEYMVEKPEEITEVSKSNINLKCVVKSRI